MEQWACSKLGKEYVKAVYCHPDYLTYMQSTSWEMPGWMNHKLELRLQGEISINTLMADDTTLMADVEEELKSLLIKVKEESEKAGLKFNIHKTKMAFDPVTLWHKDRETVTDFFFLGSKITADGDCSHELKDACSLEEKL